LEVEVHSRIQVTHKVGNPNASVLVGIRNTGGRNLRIRALRLAIARDGKPLLALPGQSYFENPSSESAVLFVPFGLTPGETWTHSVSFFNDFDRQTEKLFRESVSALSADIRRKLDTRSEHDKQAVVGEPSLTEPFHAMFQKLFVWQPGEYIVTLEVKAEPGSASYTKKYRFTLYESDTRELMDHTEDYKFGGGLTYKLEKHAGVNVPLAEHVG
jgi:hypothetical protein